MRFSDGPHFEPPSRYSRRHVLLYSLSISQCTPLHSRARRLSIRFWSGDNPVKASNGSEGQVRVVQQTGEGHSRSSAAVGAEKAI
jgi:hypothetical protein